MQCDGQCLIQQDLIKALKGPEGPYYARREWDDVGYDFEAEVMLNAMGWSGA